MDRRLYEWKLMTPDELDAAIGRMPLALVPCGSLEWHGRHMATGCDYIRGEAFCRRAAEILDGGVVLPPLYVTAPGFCNWRGSVFFSPRLVKQVAAEIYRELDKCGFRFVCMLLSHAGKMQEESFSEPAGEYMARSKVKILVTHGMGGKISPDITPGHGQANETAEFMAIEPGAVHLDRFDPADTVIPKYDGCDPDIYCKGLSRGHHDAVRAFMARKEFKWQDDLSRVVKPDSAAARFESACESLATEIKEFVDQS